MKAFSFPLARMVEWLKVSMANNTCGWQKHGSFFCFPPLKAM